MKKRELYALKKAIEFCGNLQGARFAYALGKNLDKINQEVKMIENAKRKPSKRLVEFSDKEIKLVKSFAKKDKEGNFIPSETGEYIILNEDVFNVEIAKLKEQYAEEIKEADEIKKDLETLLDEDIKIELYKINFNIIPENITTRQLSGIYQLIEE
jgi:NACalpha-BTF3-like transcription factor